MGCTDSRQQYQHEHGSYISSNDDSKAPDDTASSTTNTSLSISTRNLGDFNSSDASHTPESSLSMSQADWRRRVGGGEEGGYHHHHHHETPLSSSSGNNDGAAYDHGHHASSPCGIKYPPSASGAAFASFDVTLGGGSPSSGGGGGRLFHENMSLAELSDVAPLDHGGFCVVCSCTYRGQRAVLKVPKPQGPDGAVADLLTEIAIYKRVSEEGGHPNIAHAYGSGFHLQQGEQTPFLVLERLDGGSLAKALERSRPAGYDTRSDPVGRLPVALELADALAFLHNEAVPGGFVLHRDLKPTNIGLCAEGHVKVFDLGLSVLREVRDKNTDKYQMSGMAGSKRFMAPEVCNGLPYNEKVDVYSFAVVLWEICTLRKPFAGMSVADHYREVIVGGLRPPLDPRWPPRLVNLLQACWHGDPDRRPFIVDARDMLRQIFVDGGGSAVW